MRIQCEHPFDISCTWKRMRVCVLAFFFDSDRNLHMQRIKAPKKNECADYAHVKNDSIFCVHVKNDLFFFRDCPSLCMWRQIILLEEGSSECMWRKPNHSFAMVEYVQVKTIFETCEEVAHRSKKKWAFLACNRQVNFFCDGLSWTMRVKSGDFFCWRRSTTCTQPNIQR